MLNKGKDENINKAIEQLIDEELGKTETPDAETTEKGGAASVRQNENRESNGGGTGKNNDNYKNGSPLTEKQEMMSDKAKKAKEDKESEDEVEKAHMGEKENGSHYNDKDKDKKNKKDKKDMEKNAYKSLGELSDEEVELVKCWREEKAREEEEITKSQESTNAADLTKVISSAVTTAIEPLKKAMEQKDELIKGLQTDIKKLSSQPAYDKRSITDLDTIEKGGDQPLEISKAQIKDRMLELQFAGKGVTSIHVAEFEGTGNISDKSIKNLIMDSFK